MNKKNCHRFALVLALFAPATQWSFAQAQQSFITGDEQWDARFLPPGLSIGDDPKAAYLVAIAANGNEVYVGGIFTFAGGVPANNIAKWDGRNWSALGNGMSGGQPNTRVNAIAVSGTSIYAGGSFSKAGDISANNIAKWDPATGWSALGNGINGTVLDIALGPNGEVYAAGNFGNGHIAKWDGNSWSDLGGGVSGDFFPGFVGYIVGVAVKDNEVYVCGGFKKAGVVTANQIAKWNGSQWSALGAGIIPTNGQQLVWSVAVLGNTLVAGGNFWLIDNVRVNSIAAWNGNRWSPMGPVNNDGLAGGYSTAYDLSVSGNTLYAAGSFASAGGQPANNLATWNGSAWTGLFSERARSTSIFQALSPSGSAIYVVGGDNAMGEITTNHAAKFEGGEWSGLGSGFDAAVLQALAVNASGEVYIGGKFNAVAGVKANRIVKWNGTTWTALGSGLDGPVRAIGVRGNEIFVGGTFKNAGGAAANNIAKWDGQRWSPLGNGIDGTASQVNAIAIKGNDVYVGGAFTTAGGVVSNNIAKWDGANWSALGAGGENGVDAAVNGIALANNGEVYVGGIFSKAGSVNVKGIAKWNGASWSTLGSGITGSSQWVYATVSSGDEIYVAGRFTAAGGINSNHIAKWNSLTNSWSALGAGIGDASSSVFTLAVNGNEFIAGGLFTKAGAVSANNITKWDGNQWTALGSGTGGANPVVLALAASGDHVYAGGQFTLAGNKPSFKFAHWQGPTTAVQEQHSSLYQPKEFSLAQNYPNPFNPSTMIQYELPQAAHVRIAIYNLLGERVRTLVDAKESAGVKRVTWDGRNERGERVSSGVYVYRLEAGEVRLAKRLVLMK